MELAESSLDSRRSRPQPSRPRSRSRSRRKKKYSDTRYKKEKKSSSSSSADDEFTSRHHCCRHGTTKKDSKAFNRATRRVLFHLVFPCDVEREGEFFNETCRKCIAEYNKKHTEEPDYELLDVVMATKSPCADYNYYITFRAHQVHLPDEVKTFQATYYHCPFKDKYGGVRDCELKD